MAPIQNAQSASYEAVSLSTISLFYALSLCPRLGPAKIAKLLDDYDVEDLFASVNRHSCPQLPQSCVDFLNAVNLPNIERQLESYRHAGIDLVCVADERYPQQLKHIPDPPVILFCRGNLGLLNESQIAIVGSRGATVQGKSIAFDWAQEFARAGLTITSGLALGIDAQAHRGALHAGGQTLAVLGTGVDICYPKRNCSLYNDIASNGLLVSEFAPGSGAKAGHFPKRNRIIAGLSLATLVVEAEQKSGSLITARLAAEYNKDVMAIPGSINNHYTSGCHHLIKQGAALVEKPADVLEELGVFTKTSLYTNKTPPEQESDSALLAHMGYDPISVDELAIRSKMPVAQLLTELIDLELEGVIESTSGGYIKKGGR